MHKAHGMEEKMISDTHVHTSFSKDSTAAPPAQVERCLALGMKEVCITDHHDYQANAGENDFVLIFRTICLIWKGSVKGMRAVSG